MNLSFVGDSLVSVSQGSKPQLSVWSMSNLSLSWSYKLQVEGLVFSSPLNFLILLLPRFQIVNHIADWLKMNTYILCIQDREKIETASF